MYKILGESGQSMFPGEKLFTANQVKMAVGCQLAQKEGNYINQFVNIAGIYNRVGKN